MFKKKYRSLGKIVNGRTVFISIIALNLIFVFFSVQEKIPLFRFIIVDIMHKDIGITGRSGIWHFAELLILKNPFIGYGTGLTTITETGKWYEFIKFYGPHNQFLYILLAGGLVSLIPYLILLSYIFNVLYKNKKQNWGFIFSIGLFSMYMELLMTYRSYATCMPLFAMFVIIEYFAKKNENQNKKNIYSFGILK